MQKYNPHDLLFSEINLCCKIDIYTFSFSIELTFSSISYTWSILFSFHSEIVFKFHKNKNMDRATNTELNLSFLGRKTEILCSCKMYSNHLLATLWSLFTVSHLLNQ